MLTWELSPEIRAAESLSPGDVDRLVARIVGAIGDPDFGDTVAARLHEAAAIDFWSVYRFDPETAPVMFASGSRRGRDVSADCFGRYRRGLYRQDRTFRPAERLASEGRMAMILWNEAEIPSPHRDEIYRRHGIGERLSVVGGDGGGRLLAVNLYRYQSSGAYRGKEVDTVQALGCSLLACVRKHILVQGGSGAVARPVLAIERLRSHCSSLTTRELEVCERLLRGWTYDGIAADLGLSVTSVKTYRNRAFQRLGIHFRNELFALSMSAGSEPARCGT
ncbi:helix-turn-helix transcriptional regulator [Thauera chlorobenzoica]|uniref:helix-turn-helix transcriptional regulator n=1 Tax=Thauera chlorobenzoica TaxID=96773 RepID=UPI00089FF910|nr:helix-turn-helix transcriptional regulator [Thauera chlorobenzoica]SEG28426.1 regulatory protein, luxR family [Thauera chlorobenzoica]